MKHLFQLVLVLFFTAHSAHATSQAPSSSTNQFNQLIDNAHAYTGFNGTMLVAQGDKVLFHKAIGFADKDNKELLATEHRFSSGSVGKEFTTVALMMLAEQGKLSYQDKVIKYLDFLPKAAANVTIEQLLSHTSGLPKVQWKKFTQTQDIIEQVKGITTLPFEPGKGYIYSNINVVLRALVVEKISGSAFEQFVTEQVFKPAGMKGSVNIVPSSPKMTLKAHGDIPAAVSGLSIYTTAYDLYKFEQALWQGKLLNPAKLIDALPGDTLSGKHNRAYFDFGRFSIDDKGKLKTWEHDGTHPSHHTIKYHNFEQDVVITLMSSDGNKSTLYDLKNSAIRILKGETDYVPLTWYFKHQLQQVDTTEAVKQLAYLRQTQPHILINEHELNMVGYTLMKLEHFEKAEYVFKFNWIQNPNSPNSHDSYAEILIHNGKTALAKKVVEEGIVLAKAQENSFVLKYLEQRLEQLN